MVTVERATVAWLEALVEGDDVFAARFGLPVVEDWAGFPEAVPHTLAAVQDQPDQTWGTHLFFDDADGALVGFGGWKGAPVDGAAELGYAIAPARQGRGLATAVVEELIGRARTAGLVTALAHTLAEDNASTAVLRKTGFTQVAVVDDPGDGPLWRWERPL